MNGDSLIPVQKCLVAQKAKETVISIDKDRARLRAEALESLQTRNHIALSKKWPFISIRPRTAKEALEYVEWSEDHLLEGIDCNWLFLYGVQRQVASTLSDVAKDTTGDIIYLSRSDYRSLFL